jgi:prevent-host-death family protein
MRISITEAKARLSELVRRAESGEEVILTRRGHNAMRLVPALPLAASRRKLLEEVQAAAAGKAMAGPSAARSQDFLYDEKGVPSE